jgi:hypothetical protein
VQGAQDAETRTHYRTLAQGSVSKQHLGHFHYKTRASGRIDARPEVFGCVLRHDAEADKITALRRAIRDGGAHHAPDVPAGVDDAGEFREIRGLQVRTHSTTSNVEGVSRQKNRPSFRAQFGPVSMAISDTKNPRTLPDGPVDQIPRDMNPVPIRHRSPCFLKHAHNIGVVDAHSHIPQHLPGTLVDLFAILAVQPHGLLSFCPESATHWSS